MQNQVARACYWLGLFCGGIALAWRALVAIGFEPRIEYADRAIGFEGFYKGAVLFLLIAVATATYNQLRRG